MNKRRTKSQSQCLTLIGDPSMTPPTKSGKVHKSEWNMNSVDCRFRFGLDEDSIRRTMFDFCSGPPDDPIHKSG
jgi:hypothetical protein